MPSELDDLKAELARLVAEERAALSDEPALAQAIRCYTTCGGSLARLKQIVVIGSQIKTHNKLSGMNLPGPDEMYRGPIVSKVAESFAELMDDLFAGRSLLN